MKYEVQDQLMPKKLLGISDEQVEDHWGLYKGYVTQVNTLNEELSTLRSSQQADTLSYADRRRRLGFEYNGMVLHEYYFGNLRHGDDDLTNGELYKAFEASFGSYDGWKEDFKRAGKTRGIGWAIVYADTTTGLLTNHFIAEHENGNIAGFSPVLVMDVWEHAYMVDHKAGGRGKYIDAFMTNIHWEKVDSRFNEVKEGKIAQRF